MELKKNPKFDLTKTTTLYFSIGLASTMAILLIVFECRNYDDTLKDLGNANTDFEELVDIPITEQPPKPPPKIEIPIIEEIPDEEEIEEEIEVDLDVEVQEETEIEEIVVEDEPEEEEADQIFTIVENQPEPDGGMQAFYKYVGENMKYPPQARRMGIEGKVFVKFVVGKDGSLTDVQILKSLGYGCDEEALRIIKTAKKWKPGKQRGKPVKVQMVLPITFRLN